MQRANGIQLVQLDTLPEFSTQYQVTKLSREYFLVISLVSLALVAISGIEGIQKNIFAQTFFSYTAPLLFFTFIMSGVYYLFYDRLNYSKHMNGIIAIAGIGGILSTLFALTINSRAVLLILVSYASLSLQNLNIYTLYMLMYAVAPPFIEEFAKLLPIFILSRTTYTDPEDGERRMLSSLHEYIFTGIFVGAIFTTLETYFYAIRGYNLVTDTVNDNFIYIFTQVLLRFTIPVHIITTTLMAFGLSLIAFNKVKRSISYSDYGLMLLFYFAAVGIHAMWNGFLVHSAFYKPFGGFFTIFDQDLPRVIVIFHGILALLLIFYIFHIRNALMEHCTYCHEWHKKPYELEDHISPVKMSSDILTKVKTKLLRKNNVTKCVNCGAPRDDSAYCKVCGSFDVLTCGNCNSVVSLYATECWNCKFTLNNQHLNLLHTDPTFGDVIAVGTSRVLASFYVPISLSGLLYLVLKAANIVYVVQSVFLLLMGSSILVVYKWSFSQKKAGISIALSRIVAGIFFLDLLLLATMLISAVFALLLTIAYSINTLLLFLFAVIVSLVLLLLVLKFIIDSKPLIHGGNSNE